MLAAVLDGELEISEGADADAVDSWDYVGLGVLPRDLQLLVRDEERVGVESVSAFAEASQFWWLVSYLWCMEVGRSVDRRLDTAIFGYRLDPGFARSPSKSGRMFATAPPISKRWARVATTISAENDGRVVAAATVDLRGFYYSIDASPTAIVQAFVRGTSRAVRVSSRGRALTRLLDIAHAMYAEQDRRLSPRPAAQPRGSRPLPVGFPSSQILANLVIAVVLRDLAKLRSVAGLSAYADDVLIVSTTLPEVGETAPEYLQRIGVVSGDLDGDPVLSSRNGAQLASLIVATEKCGISYSRAPQPREEPEPRDDSEGVTPRDEGFSGVGALDPYLDPVSGDDWGGRLRTVLRAPFRRERVPREIVADIRNLVDEIRVGADVDHAATALARVLNNLDRAAILELRSYWTELLACADFAGQAEALNAVISRIRTAIATLEPPAEANAALREAIEAGLHFSLKQALAEALAVTRGREVVMRGFDEELQARILRVRNRRFVVAGMVSAPLAEFTDWSGPLLGTGAYEAFEAWAVDALGARAEHEITVSLRDAKRFVPLHEVCLAIHLWIAPGVRSWRTRLFHVFAEQPLLDPKGVTDLRQRVRRALRLSGAESRVDDVGSYRVRFGIPSVGVSGEQLKAIIGGDHATTSRIARAARKGIIALTREAGAKRANALVLPEWSVPARQLPYVFDMAARRQMLIVGGEAPRVRGGQYSNRVWTGIPLMDSATRRSCLVPPPREKRYLSSEEQRDLAQAGLSHGGGAAAVPVYEWRGITFASLLCFEFADIKAREALRSRADVLTVSSWNMDWRYFDAIQEATTRDNYCVTVCVNTSQFPGTHVMRPTRSEKCIALSVHGSGHPTVVTRTLDVLPLIAARASGIRPSSLAGFLAPTDDLELEDYKALPPTFES